MRLNRKARLFLIHSRHSSQNDFSLTFLRGQKPAPSVTSHTMHNRKKRLFIVRFSYSEQNDFSLTLTLIFKYYAVVVEFEDFYE